MIAEIGHYALVLALALALIQATLPMIGARVGDPTLMGIAEPVAVVQFLFVALSFAALTALYVTSDFSVANVFENSHSQKPLIYKISGVWGNHEGSMLLWVLILAVFGAMVAIFSNNLPASLRANVLGVQSWIAAAFQLFILATSNPFARLPQAPFEGRDLNPILQDFGLAMHPPLLYLGYVGFSISFSFAVAALIEGRIDAAWARWVRPWTLAAWMFLTLGIAMGSYWAYYELGWGGWWFWDPVENASLMPWIAGTALLHSAVVMEKRNALKVWTILLAILAFSLSLLGTFLVRSGVLTSVHTFASDPSRGVFILAILVFFIGGSLALFAWRAPALKQGGLFAPISREGALVFNNLFLTTACATVLVGTLYPLALEGADRREDFGRRAVLQRDLRPAIPAADDRDAVRAAAGLEARRSLCRCAAADGGLCDRADCDGGDLCDHAGRAGAGAVPDRDCVLCDGRRAHRSGRAHAIVPPVLRRVDAPLRRPAALDARHRGRAFRARRLPARHRRRGQLRRRAHSVDEARTDRVAARLRSHLQRSVVAHRARIIASCWRNSPSSRGLRPSAFWSRRSALSRRAIPRPPRPPC